MLIGHKTIIRDLKKLADVGDLAHGYVFCGPEMIGKRFTAESLANFLETGSFELPKLLQDCLVIKPIGNTIGIDQVREIKNFLWQKPAISSRRTLILDDAHSMTAEAQNALLKITEEPPASSLILLVTSDPDALNPTVFSRLQKIYFSPVSANELTRWVEEKFGNKKDVTAAVSKSLGRPGLICALLTDERFTESIVYAERLLQVPADKRRDLLKKMTDQEDFSFRKLLDTLIIISSWEFIEEKNVSFWHALLRLRHDAAYFNLNPRLQIESLFQGR
ncbi:MAG TPA: AAA family ATPase [Patescibacteria group bacterium]|nr:AAA family ATPase [Patescibacteria group bacterium]